MKKDLKPRNISTTSLKKTRALKTTEGNKTINSIKKIALNKKTFSHTSSDQTTNPRKSETMD